MPLLDPSLTTGALSDTPLPQATTPEEAVAHAASLPHLTLEQAADNLLRGGAGYEAPPVGPLIITFGFLDATSATADSMNGLKVAADIFSGFLQLNADQKAAFAAATHVWEQYANVKFVYVENPLTPGFVQPGYSGVTLTVGGFTHSETFTSGFTSVPFGGSPTDFHADLYLNTGTYFATQGPDIVNADGSITYHVRNLDPGGFAFYTMLHELGHSLGLEHPGGYNAGDGNTFESAAGFVEDDQAYTLMSYWSEWYGSANFRDPLTGQQIVAQTPMASDVVAVTRLYGAADATVGDTVYGFGEIDTALKITGPADKVVGSIDDASGRNTLDVSPFAEGAVIDLGQLFQSVGGLLNNIAILNQSIQDLKTGSGDDSIKGSDVGNVIHAAGGDDTIWGMGGGDTLYGGGGRNSLFGGDGDDSFIIGAPGEGSTIDGGDGYDTVYVDLSGAALGVTVDLTQANPANVAFDPGAPPAFVVAALISNVESVQVELGSGADTVYGGAAGENVYGGAGKDVLHGGGGDDLIYGGGEDDTLYGGTGIDHLYGDGGDDTFIVDAPGAGSTIDGGTGFDTVIIDTSAYGAGVTVDLNTGIPGGPPGGPGGPAPNAFAPQMTNVESVQVTTGSGADIIYGSTGADTVYAGGGNDFIQDAGGADKLYGGDGNDRIIDKSNFGGGTDLIYGDDGADWITVGSGVATVYGGKGGDLIENFEFSFGPVPALTDSFYGGDDDDTIRTNAAGFFDGGAGADTLSLSMDHSHDSQVLDLRDPNALVTTTGTGMSFIHFESYEIAFGIADDTVTIMYGAGQYSGGSGFGSHDTIYIYLAPGQAVPTWTETTDIFGETTRTFANGLVVTGFEAISVLGVLNLVNGTLGNDNLTGTAGADQFDGLAGKDVMSGGLGDDTYIVDNPNDKVIENPNEGTDTIFTGLASYSLAALPNVENLTYTGSGAFKGVGNAAHNVITGGAGADSLDGGAGVDRLVGGGGDDTYFVDDSADVISELPGGGVDTVRSTADYVLSANVEKLYLLGGALHGTGNTLNNTLVGNALDNILDGGAGADLMQGGAGADTYYVDDVGDVVQESGSGVDTVHTTLNSYVLPSNVEALIFDGAGDFTGTGNGGINTITGGAGNDVLDGGKGADTLVGGLGNDTYKVDNKDEIIVEGAGAGTDTIMASTNYVLAAGVSVETIIAVGSGGLTLLGNEIANDITGNASANTLYGGGGDDSLHGGGGNDILDGGTGADAMDGGTGDDRYVVDDASDVVTENPLEGTDLVTTTIDYALPDFVENLTLSSVTGLSGAGNALPNTLTGSIGDDTLRGWGDVDKVYGGAGKDTLYGGSENDSLYGGDNNDVLWGDSENDLLDGGAGADELHGGAGHDTYVIDNSGDQIFEAANEGQDQAKVSAASYILSDNVETMIFTGVGDFSGTGSSTANTITGGDGNDILSGLGGGDTLNGGKGADVLYGGAGVDTLDGGAGADIMDGGADNDSYVVDDVGDVIIEAAGAGNDYVSTTLASYTLAENLENLSYKGAGPFTGTGNEADNFMSGGGGDATLYGGGGDDKLFGGPGNNALYGGDGKDGISSGTTGGSHALIVGGAGADSLYGGPGQGQDTFAYTALSDSTVAAPDTIYEFVSGEDVIDLSGIDANSLAPGDQAFSWVGTNVFSHTAGELRYQVGNGILTILGDVNGDGLADFAIKMSAIASMSADDFHP
jgi:Ca2+-binding RTX toxin-like protein